MHQHYAKLIVYPAALSLSLLASAASAQIYSHTEASSDTGGNVVGPGGTIVTGSESASVQVRNVVGGTSSVQITTEVNGQVRQESFSADKKLEVTVTATPERTETRVIRDERPAEVRVHTNAAADVQSASVASRTPLLALEAPSIIDHIAGFFDWLLSLFR
jgi:hypothetical protein